MQSYRDLKVWQESMKLATGIYGVTGEFPTTERYGLSQQLRRAAVSHRTLLRVTDARPQNSDTTFSRTL